MPTSFQMQGGGEGTGGKSFVKSAANSRPGSTDTATRGNWKYSTVRKLPLLNNLTIFIKSEPMIKIHLVRGVSESEKKTNTMSYT